MEVRESCVCPGCGCLCDDLDVQVADNRVAAAANVCLWGAAKFLFSKKFHPKKERRRVLEPQRRHRGRWQGLSYDAALEEAAWILGQARRPVIYGLTQAGCWAQEAALEVARQVRGRLEPADLGFLGPYYAGLKERGVHWAPLEVIRDEADTLVFWGANPLHACPRHLVRYSAFARGRFTEGGLEERQVAVVDIYRTEMAELAHLFLTTVPGRELDLIQEVRAALLGEAGGGGKGPRQLAEMLQKAAYGVLFFGRGLSYGPAALMTELFGLITQLQRDKPFYLFPLASDYNSFGLSHLLLRELGSPQAPTFGTGGEYTLEAAPVDFRQADAVLVVGADLIWALGPEQAAAIRQQGVPIITISPFTNHTTALSQVVLPAALDGVEAEEIAYRMDGLPVRLRPVVEAPWTPTYQILRDLHGKLGSAAGRGEDGDPAWGAGETSRSGGGRQCG